MEYIVYHIKNIKTNFCYIGATNNYKKRVLGHKNHLRKKIHKNKRLQEAFDIDGEEQFLFEVLFKFNSQEEMFLKEKELISKTPFIYNIASGGLGGDFSKYWTQEEKDEHFSKVVENLRRYREVNGTARNNPFLNKEGEELDKLLEKWSNCKKGSKNNMAKYFKKVAQIKDGEVVKIWDNVYEVAEDSFYNRKYIIKCALKSPSFKTHRGFEWEFIED